MKKVLITGGNKGIGLETTKLFLEKGYEAVVVARDFSNFSLEHEHIQKIPFDLTDIANISDIYDQVGEIDILINNAGIMHSLKYNEYDNASKDRMLQITLEAPIELIKAFTRNNKTLRIVNNASIAGHIGHPDIWYGITKAGVINMTKSFAKILGPEGVVINCIAAGPVQTDMLSSIPTARQEQIQSSLITERFATPQEVAQSFYVLGVETPSYINGTCMDINNGAFMR